MKKKILLMVPRVHQGGQERICLLTARLLQKEHDVTVLIYDDTDCVYDLSGLRIINIHSKAHPNRFVKLLRVGQRVMRVRRIKKREKYDICYSFGATANLVNIFSKKGEQVWVGIRGYDDVDDVRRTGLFCRYADKVVCCARIMERDLAAKYTPRDVASLYNPCDTEEILRRREESLPAEEEAFFAGGKVLITMGRDAHLKGYWHLLKAFSLVLKKVPDAKLLILGRGEYRACKELAQALQITDRVWFAGVRNNPFPYLKRSTLYILSSQDGEGFPNALAEAMAAGLPVAATNCKSGPAEILFDEYEKAEDRSRIYEADYGILLPIGEDAENYEPNHIEPQEEEMAGALISLLTDTEKAEHYRRQAGRRAADFSNETYLREFKKLL